MSWFSIKQIFSVQNMFSAICFLTLSVLVSVSNPQGVILPPKVPFRFEVNRAKVLYDHLFSNRANFFWRMIKPAGYSSLKPPKIPPNKVEGDMNCNNNSTSPLQVNIMLKLVQLINLDMRNQQLATNIFLRQQWVDERLTWDPKQYGGHEQLQVDPNLVWLPDIVLYNNADGRYWHKHEDSHITKILLHYNGSIIWEPPAIVNSFCAINMHSFPYDKQCCSLKFGSWSYSAKQLDLRLTQAKKKEEGYVDMSLFDDTNAEWELKETAAKCHMQYYSYAHLDAEPYSDAIFTICMKRRSIFYTVNLVMPSAAISFISVLAFCLPLDSLEKISLSSSILLVLLFFLNLHLEISPPSSLVIPLLGKYLLSTTLLIFLSTAGCVYSIHTSFVLQRSFIGSSSSGSFYFLQKYKTMCPSPVERKVRRSSSSAISMKNISPNTTPNDSISRQKQESVEQPATNRQSMHKSASSDMAVMSNQLRRLNSNSSVTRTVIIRRRRQSFDECMNNYHNIETTNDRSSNSQPIELDQSPVFGRNKEPKKIHRKNNRNFPLKAANPPNNLTSECCGTSLSQETTVRYREKKLNRLVEINDEESSGEISRSTRRRKDRSVASVYSVSDVSNSSRMLATDDDDPPQPPPLFNRSVSVISSNNETTDGSGTVGSLDTSSVTCDQCNSSSLTKKSRKYFDKTMTHLLVCNPKYRRLLTTTFLQQAMFDIRSISKSLEHREQVKLIGWACKERGMFVDKILFAAFLIGCVLAGGEIFVHCCLPSSHDEITAFFNRTNVD